MRQRTQLAIDIVTSAFVQGARASDSSGPKGQCSFQPWATPREQKFPLLIRPERAAQCEVGVRANVHPRARYAHVLRGELRYAVSSGLTPPLVPKLRLFEDAPGRRMQSPKLRFATDYRASRATRPIHRPFEPKTTTHADNVQLPFGLYYPQRYRSKRLSKENGLSCDYYKRKRKEPR